MPKLLFARPPVDAVEERRIRKLAGARHAPADWIRRARMTLTKTVVDVGATSGSGVELSDGIHTDHGGRRLVRLTPEQAVVDQHRDGAFRGGTGHAPRPQPAPRTSTATTTSALVPCWRPPRRSRSNPPPKHSSTPTAPLSGCRSGLTIARRSGLAVATRGPGTVPREYRIHGGQLLHDPRTH